MNTIQVKRLVPQAILPTRRDGDIGWDLYAATVEPIAPALTKIGTGIAVQLPEGYWGQIESRSSMGKQGYDTHGGIIDNHYRGEIIVVMACHHGGAPKIEPGQKIAQLIVRKQEDSGWPLTEVDNLGDTARGAAGFGSTGK